jgi:Cof subfamily protein (haloacid dehalogenase superfamily)
MGLCKLLAVDVDGTLSVPGHNVPEEVIGALQACMRAGILVVLSTGKKFSSIRELCKEVGIEGPAITCNGAIVINTKSEAVLFSHFFPKKLFKTIISEVEKDNRLSIALFTDCDIICTHVNLASKLLASINEPTTRFVQSLFSLSSENIAKVLVAVDNIGMLRNMYRMYADRYGQDCSVTITSDKFLEFMPPHVSKGNSLAELATSMGIDRQNITCIGDSDNDLSMFDVSGFSIAVANATPAVLKAADIIGDNQSGAFTLPKVDLVDKKSLARVFWPLDFIFQLSCDSFRRTLWRCILFLGTPVLILFTASWYDGTLKIHCDDVGLLEHYGFHTFFIVHILLIVLLRRTITKFVYALNKVGSTIDLSEVQRQEAKDKVAEIICSTHNLIRGTRFTG